jgi:peptidoglycan/xylan/chitin deacetylase (PgdA/CDA1 family)
MIKQKLALRIDDIGASTKEYEIYSKNWFGLGNFLFLKYMNYFKAWAKYREMNAQEWHQIFRLLRKYNAKLTVGITASWVNYDGTSTKFNEKFPEEADALKLGMEEGLIEIANHGLTHCVVKDNLFRPRLFSSNRTYHREFWEWLGEELHHEHLKESQRILQGFFKVDITTLIPPGNVYCDFTIDAAQKYGIKNINCQTSDEKKNGLNIISNNRVYAFHDKEIVEEGLDWFENVLKMNQSKKFVFVRDVA